MSSTEALEAFWERLFRCSTLPSADREIAAERSVDAARARAAWRAHRATLARDEAQWEARARDLEGLQGLGRSLSEARTVAEVFERAAFVLQSLTDADAVAVASALQGH